MQQRSHHLFPDRCQKKVLCTKIQQHQCRIDITPTPQPHIRLLHGQNFALTVVKITPASQKSTCLTQISVCPRFTESASLFYFFCIRLSSKHFPLPVRSPDFESTAHLPSLRKRTKAEARESFFPSTDPLKKTCLGDELRSFPVQYSTIILQPYHKPLKTRPLLFDPFPAFRARSNISQSIAVHKTFPLHGPEGSQPYIMMLV